MVSCVPGLADGLRGRDADRLTDVDQLAGGHRTTVTRADAVAAGAGQHRADLDLLTPAASSASIAGSPRSCPRSATTLPFLVDRVGSQRANAESRRADRG